MTDKSKFDKLVSIMAQLRGPDGCLWDQQQTHESIKPHLIEEAYEVVETIDENDFTKLKEELGDLLLQVVFHAQMADEEGLFGIDDVIDAIVNKLERRHPHVFGEVEVSSSKEIIARWEKIKRGEDEKNASRIAGIPDSLPALFHAYKLQSKMAHIGFDWKTDDDLNKAYLAELQEFNMSLKGQGDLEEELADIIFMIVNIARRRGIEPETALKKAMRKFSSRFCYMEEMAEKSGIALEDMSLEEQDRLWNEAKALENDQRPVTRNE